MDTALKLMTEDTRIFGFVVHNWLFALAGVVVLWVFILVRDA